MCGIIGIVQKEKSNIGKDLLRGIKRLEYRGYDSVGMVSFDRDRALLKKDVGEVSIVDKKLHFSEITGKAGLAHSRWATNGGVTKKNAHPHHNKDNTIFAVHNGIIENSRELRSFLEKKGYLFETETDSEIIPHYFDHYLNKIKKKTVKEVMQQFMKEATGTFAILILIKGAEKIYAMKRDSPLVLGISPERCIIGSDIYAFSGMTDKAIFFEDDEGAVIEAGSFEFFDKEGRSVKKKPVSLLWKTEEETKEEYDHYMIKEIHEQPTSSRRLIESLKVMQKDELDKMVRLIKSSRRVVFVAAGTSYHASLLGVYLLKKRGIKAHTVIASEFENFLWVDKETLVIAVTQSGETMDVVSVLKNVKKIGCKIAAIVNVPYSTIQRMSEVTIEISAGQEICVAATKTFTNQAITMIALGNALGHDAEIEKIPENIRKTIELNEKKIKKISRELKDKKDIFVLGRGINYPIAREIALKLKEIAYIHAEGMMGGELKHGTIALIEKDTPVISLIPEGGWEMLSNTKEVEARGARSIIITNTDKISGTRFSLIAPEGKETEFAIYSAILGHLLSYYIAKENNLEIDKPRNLAKSVTVK